MTRKHVSCWVAAIAAGLLIGARPAHADWQLVTREWIPIDADAAVLFDPGSGASVSVVLGTGAEGYLEATATAAEQPDGSDGSASAGASADFYAEWEWDGVNDPGIWEALANIDLSTTVAPSPINPGSGNAIADWSTYTASAPSTDQSASIAGVHSGDNSANHWKLPGHSGVGGVSIQLWAGSGGYISANAVFAVGMSQHSLN